MQWMIWSSPVAGAGATDTNQMFTIMYQTTSMAAPQTQVKSVTTCALQDQSLPIEFEYFWMLVHNSLHTDLCMNSGCIEFLVYLFGSTANVSCTEFRLTSRFSEVLFDFIWFSLHFGCRCPTWSA